RPVWQRSTVNRGAFVISGRARNGSPGRALFVTLDNLHGKSIGISSMQTQPHAFQRRYWKTQLLQHCSCTFIAEILYTDCNVVHLGRGRGILYQSEVTLTHLKKCLVCTRRPRGLVSHNCRTNQTFIEFSRAV